MRHIYAAHKDRVPCFVWGLRGQFSARTAWQAYRDMFEMTLREQLESDLSGDFKAFMVFTQMETQEFDALLMKKAM